MMAQVSFVSLLIILLAWLIMCSWCSGLDEESRNEYIQDACSVTRYRDLCIHSLAPFSSTAKHNPSRWARAGVSVTIGEAKRVVEYLGTLKKSNNTTNLKRRRNQIALSDCVECFQDTLDNLHKSLGVLRKLSVGEFTSQLEDVTTWVSAALTDEDTCLDGFDERIGKRVRVVINRVLNVTYMTSNALALVNKLATSGPECLVNY